MQAVEELEGALSIYDSLRTHDAIRAVKGYYYLGLAYEKSGWSREAIKRYKDFLEIWEEADPGISEMEDAQKRPAAHKSSTQSRT